MADIQHIQRRNQHYIKTVSGKVVAQSIAFRVVSICWQGYLRSLDIWTQRDRPALEAPALHTLRLIMRHPAPCRHCVTSLRSAHSGWPMASSLKLAARCPVSGCWPSCLKYRWYALCLLYRGFSERWIPAWWSELPTSVQNVNAYELLWNLGFSAKNI